MNRFEQIISPFSWIVLNAAFTSMFVIVFSPTWLELLVALSLDFVALQMARRVDKWLFIRIYPDSVPYFLETEFPEMKSANLNERLSIFHSMIRYPARRAFYSVVLSYLKGIPAYCVVIFYWKHDVSNLLQFLKLVGLIHIVYAYFYGAIFIENHGLISEKIKSFHALYDWTAVFQHAEVPFYKSEFEIQEVVSFIAIWIFILLLQVILLFTDNTQKHPWLFVQWTVVTLASFGLFSRLWYLNRKYLQGGLQSLFYKLEQFEPEKFQETLPLHSSPLIARFEKTFNTLILRLRSYKQELARWTFIRAEESRFRALGEISSLIVHDLSSPLHVIQFCATELKSNPERIRDPRYIKQLVLNGERALELVSSLRAYLKNPVSESLSTPYRNAHEHVVRLLDTQFRATQSEQVEFHVDPNMWDIRFRLSSADLIHLLFNFFKNSIENYLERFPSTPRIDISLESKTDAEVTFSVRDFGTGLSPERFEELTGLNFTPTNTKQSREGLGLRLVRRLVERNEGSIRVATLEPGSQGTCFLITLKIGEQLPK